MYKKYRHFWLMFLAGLLLAASRLPLHTGFLVFWSLIPIFILFNSKLSIKQILISAYVFSFVYIIVSLHWINLVTIPGFFGMIIIIGLYFFILFLLVYKLWHQFPKIKYLSFILLWLSFEILQNFGEFRFPWFNIGYSLADYLPLIQPAEIGGIYLLSLLIIIINILIYNLINNFKKNIIILSVVIILWSSYGILRLRNIRLKKSDTKVAMVQVSVPQNKKWKDKYLDSTIALYKNFTQKAAKEDPSLIIWPESALPVYSLKQSKYRLLIKKLAKENGADIFTGFPHYIYAGKDHPSKYKFYNAATKFGKDGDIAPYYSKNILVPFGERIPFLKYFPFLWNIHLGQANWEYGKEQKFYNINNETYSPLICFEIAFERLTTKIARQDVDFIVNITNDAWFYRSAGTYQHAIMAKFRAIETRKQVFRAANTGYSLVVSPSGKIRKKSKLFEKTIILDNVLIYNGRSYFTKYLSWFPFVFIIGALILMIFWLSKYLYERSKRLENNKI